MGSWFSTFRVIGLLSMMLFLFILMFYLRVEKGSLGMGVNNKSEAPHASSKSDIDVSLAGYDNKGYILTTVSDVVNWLRTGAYIR